MTIVGASNEDRVTIRATAASSSQGDCKVRVEYLYQGSSSYDIKTLTVSTPTTTTSYKGNLAIVGQYVRRFYYHEVQDQFGWVLPVTGMYCEEDIEHLEGQTGWRQHSPGLTANHSRDGAWGGGIAVRDHLEAPDVWYSKDEQTLSVCGAETSPTYTIVLDTGDLNSDRVWKE